ncbi:MAG: DMT family transporter [Pelolinea sp.]|nr:DMT family transporter [Pelolinea sp.]
MHTENESLNKKALIEIGFGILLLGTGPMFVKFAKANGAIVAFYRLLFAGLMFTLPAIIHSKNKQPSTNNSKQVKWVVLGGLAIAVNLALWCSALNYTSASIVTLLDNTAPVWIGLFSWLVLGKKQKYLYWIGLGLALSGSILLVGSNLDISNGRQAIGNILSVASGISYASYIMITQQARKTVSSLRYTWLVSGIGAGFLFVFSFITGAFYEPISIKSFVLIFLMALSSQVFGWYLVNDALGKLPVTGASVALVGQPVVTTILAIFVLQEVPTIFQVIGGIICVIGIFVVQRSFLKNDLIGEGLT